MAGTAEAVAAPFAQPRFRPPFEVVTSDEVPTAVPPEPIEWRDADAISGLRLAREAAELKAKQILQERIRLLGENPEAAEVPNPVDPLTTAGRALEAKKDFGADSPEYAEAWTSLVHDCARLLAESYRKNRPEHFAETEQPFNEVIGDYEFMGYPLTTMVDQGITPLAEKDEQTNRDSEYIEEATFRAVRGLGSLAVGKLTLLRPGRPAFAGAAQDAPEARVMTISECPDWAIDAYKRKSKGGWAGYAPEKEKLMVRGVRFGNNNSRYQEQLGLPGMYITHDVVVEGMRRMRVVSADEHPTKEEVRRKQLVNLSGKDVFAIAEVLDTVASEQSGKTIFMGEEVDADHPRDYQAFREEAAQRQAQQGAQAEELATYLMGLESSGIDHWVAQGVVEIKVKKMVFKGVKGDPEAAAAAFDEKTAEYIEEANERRANGDEEGAQKIEAQAEEEAPPASFCGAGSCGLEMASVHDANEARSALGSDGDVLYFKDGVCGNCNVKGGVLLLVDKETGVLIGKYCSGCKATEGGNASAEPADSDSK